MADAMKNVVLIGFMGTGKTSVGRLIATRLGCSFHDLDKRIEEQHGMRIPVMFSEYGEAYFRAREKEAVREAAGRTLTADVDTILQRTSARGARPVLDQADEGDRRRAIERLLEERRGLYEGADITVDTSGRAPLEVAEHVLHALRIWRK